MDKFQYNPAKSFADRGGVISSDLFGNKAVLSLAKSKYHSTEYDIQPDQGFSGISTTTTTEVNFTIKNKGNYNINTILADITVPAGPTYIAQTWFRLLNSLKVEIGKIKVLDNIEGWALFAFLCLFNDSTTLSDVFLFTDVSDVSGALATAENIILHIPLFDILLYDEDLDDKLDKIFKIQSCAHNITFEFILNPTGYIQSAAPSASLTNFKLRYDKNYNGGNTAQNIGITQELYNPRFESKTVKFTPSGAGASYDIWDKIKSTVKPGELIGFLLYAVLDSDLPADQFNGVAINDIQFKNGKDELFMMENVKAYKFKLLKKHLGHVPFLYNDAAKTNLYWVPLEERTRNALYEIENVGMDLSALNCSFEIFSSSGAAQTLRFVAIYKNMYVLDASGELNEQLY